MMSSKVVPESWTAESNPLTRPKIADSIVDLIGATPLLRLGAYARENGVVGNIILKLESLEPASSVKDRLGKALIEGAEARGQIRPGESILVEPTSGSMQFFVNSEV